MIVKMLCQIKLLPIYEKNYHDMRGLENQDDKLKSKAKIDGMFLIQINKPI